jgi:ATP-dependent Clp protease ATP-binding subunit ClpC
MTDSLGRRIDFKNTIILMTSNIGTRKLKEFGTGVGFGTKARKGNKADDSMKVIQDSLKKHFAPEFLNRLDDVIIFNSLEKEDIQQIIGIEIEKLQARITKLGYKIKINKAATEFLVEKGFDPDYGARPLKRAIQKYVEDPVAEEMVKNPDIAENSTISISTTGKGEDIEIVVTITEPKTKDKNNGDDE